MSKPGADPASGIGSGEALILPEQEVWEAFKRVKAAHWPLCHRNGRTSGAV